MGIFFGDRQISYHLNMSRRVYSRNKEYLPSLAESDIP